MTRTTGIGITLVIVAHFLVGALAVYLANELRYFRPAVLFFGATIGAQICLLGMWGALAGVSRWQRVVVVLLGVAWIWIVVVRTDKSIDSLHGLFPALLILLATSVAWAGGSVLRYAGLELARVEGDSPASGAGLRFSLRQLLGLAAAITLLLALGRFLRATADAQSLLVVVLTWCVMILAVVTVGMLPWWAVMGKTRPLLRLVAMVCCALLAGALFAWLQNGPLWRFISWPTALVLQASVTTASLLVVRACGYRLVSARGMHAPPGGA